MRRFLGAALVAAAVVAVPTYGQNAPEAVRTYKAGKELVRWIDLEGHEETIWRVATGGLQAGDEVRVRAELGLTNDVATKKAQSGSFVFRNMNRYVLRVHGHASLGKGLAFAKETTTITPENHHGLLVVSGSETLQQANAGDVTLVATSEARGANKPPTGAVKLKYPGAIAPPGGKCLTRVDQGKGEMTVLVLSSGWSSTWSSAKLSTNQKDVKINQLKPQQRKVAISLALGPVKQGEVFDVKAKLFLEAAKNMRPQLVSGQFLLCENAGDTKGVKVSGHHGFNVAPGKKDVFVKATAFTAAKDYPNGAFLNLVVNSNGKIAGTPRRLTVDDKKSAVEGTRYTKK